MQIKMGSRSSKLALAQSKIIMDLLSAKHPELSVLIKTYISKGDKILDVPLYNIGGKNLFCATINKSLINKEIDIAVHSAKDVEFSLPSELTVGATIGKKDVADVFIGRDFNKIELLPVGSTIGTSSPRRSSQLLNVYPHLKIINIRGNVETRIEKLNHKKPNQVSLDGIILALAGIKRLNIDIEKQILDTNKFTPAAGQGAIVCIIRKNDKVIKNILQSIDNPIAKEEFYIEHKIITLLGATCSSPIGVFAKKKEHQYFIKIFLGKISGKKVFHNNYSCHENEIQLFIERIVKDIKPSFANIMKL